ncbi:hypothetical protein [Streptomyces sp. SID13726]|uniref:hypothetical protein n=1 Tax=Streptomyces sp. SID13726 TaxID=2706058 RepID=UPI0013BC3105|nr:hypothetical protein [Streptomyces sp. SID13726]NEB05448.1 hypothetical protein [Streptomyces sp. SID13726]
MGASAAAFATGVALESPAWGAVVAPLAWSVALSRVCTGVHVPSDRRDRGVRAAP